MSEQDPISAEIVAMRAIADILESLDEQQRGRVLAWASAVFPSVVVRRTGERTYRGRATLPSQLLSLLSDGQPRSVNEIEDALPAPPARLTIINRLNEMVEDGRLQRVSKGIYSCPAVSDADSQSSESEALTDE